MKKIITLAIAAVCLVFTSCLKSSQYEPQPTDPGKAIYALVDAQNNFVLDPARLAFKLNILLTTAKENGDENFENLRDIRVKLTSKATSESNLYTHFFPDYEVERLAEDPNIWSIKMQDVYSSSDYVREGELRINTQGKLLGEGTTWTITSANKYYVSSGSTRYEVDLGDYSIAGGNGEWNIDIYGFSFSPVVSNPPTSDWDLSLSVSQNTATQTYEDVRDAIFEVEGYGSGNPIGYAYNFEYETRSPLQYQAACPDKTVTLLIGGKEKASCVELTLNHGADFPSPSVNVQWKRISECSASYQVSYNGYTYDSSTGNTSQSSGTEDYGY